MRNKVEQGRVSDVLGVGFGPSNLALAIAVDEYNADPGALSGPLQMSFLERQPRFGWHRGMLLEGSTVQVSFLKDLVTLRNPASRFGFLSYLHARGRLADFINHKCLFPSRAEFHDYLEWAAERFHAVVEYRSEVLAVHPVRDDRGVVTAFDVVARRTDEGKADDEKTANVTFTRRCRNLVLATGLEPRLPEDRSIRPPSERIWHNEDLLFKLERYPGPVDGRFVVVGAGQGAAETVEYLYRTFPAAEVCAVFARYGYSPADDTPFANRIFDPGAVDAFYGAPEDVKLSLLDYHANTNYSVVDPDLIDELYRLWYQERVHGRNRLRILNHSRVEVVEPAGDGLRVVIEDRTSGERQVLPTDVLVYATGYQPSDPMRMLGDAAELFATDDQGRPVVARDYRVMADDDVQAGLYLQGPTEHSHGLTSTLLSTTACRVGEIVRSIVDRLHAREPVTAQPTAARESRTPTEEVRC